MLTDTDNSTKNNPSVDRAIIFNNDGIVLYTPPPPPPQRLRTKCCTNVT